MPAFDEEAVSSGRLCEADMGGETVVKRKKRRLDAHGAGLAAQAHSRTPARGRTPMTKSPARKSSRASASLRSCDGRSTEGAPESDASAAATGNGEEKEKMPWGVGASL